METRQIVLIVDDTPENLRVLGDMMEQEGYEVQVAANGMDALDNAGAVPAPDLILLDIMMPEMDGYEVCRRLKADPELRKIPVIFISALGMSEQKVQGFREGAVDYISKPFQAEEVVARVNAHLTLKRQTDQLRYANEEMAVKNERLLDLQNVLAEKIAELESALQQVVKLEGIIPICMYCKKIRNDKDSWQQLEQYICAHSRADFSHGICPKCFQELYGDELDNEQKQK